MRQTATVEMRFDEGKAASSGATRPSDSPFWLPTGRLRSNFVAARLVETEKQTGNPGNVGLRHLGGGIARAAPYQTCSHSRVEPT
jgi:hypothetical protein